MWKVVLVLGILAFAIQASPSREALSWNALCGADKTVFHEEVDTVFSKSSNDNTVLAELDQLLGQDDILQTVYSNYVAQYKNKKDERRSMNPTSKATFKMTLLSIVAHNLAAQKGEFSWTEGVNQFTDMSDKEYSEYIGVTDMDMSTTSRRGIPTGSTFQPDIFGAPPSSVNWVDRGKVTTVKNQGDCWAGYAFAVMGALESAYLIKHSGVPKVLSAQQIVDCSRNGGCSGGGINSTIEYLMNGVADELEYPYKGKQGVCRKDAKPAGAKITSSQDVLNEKDLLTAVAKGPVPVIVDARCDGFKNYKKGILTQCSEDPNHVVLITGYDKEKKNPFWDIKNSFGEDWGERGFIRIYRGNGTAGIGQYGTAITCN